MGNPKRSAAASDMKRRNLILLLGGTSSGALSVGTGAFSSARAERDVAVNVVDDDQALVGYHAPKAQSGSDDTVTNGDRITLVEIRNRFHETQEISLVGVQIETGHEILTDYEVERTLDSGAEEFEPVDVPIAEGSTEPETVDAPEDGFGPGGYERITAEVRGIAPGETVPIAVTVTVKGVSGTGVSAQLFGGTRVFKITGAEKTDITGNVNSVKFPGNSGKVQIRTEPDEGSESSQDDSNGVVTASAYYEADDDDCVKQTGYEEVAVDTQLKPENFGSAEFASIVGVKIEGINGVFVHPNYESAGESTSNSSGNSGGEIFVDDDRPTESEAFDLCGGDEPS